MLPSSTSNRRQIASLRASRLQEEVEVISDPVVPIDHALLSTGSTSSFVLFAAKIDTQPTVERLGIWLG